MRPKQPFHFSPDDDSEELARAEIYGLLASLFSAPPSVELHAQLQVAVTEAPVAGAFLERSWSDLVDASRRLGVDAIGDEYGALFLGVGRAEILPYASYHLDGSLNAKALVTLRHDLRALGLERPETVTETEDHIAALCEAMRYLIAGNDAGTSNLATQQRFYNAHLRGWIDGFCDLLEAHPRADFYRSVAGFTRDFADVEAQGLDLLDA